MADNSLRTRRIPFRREPPKPDVEPSRPHRRWLWRALLLALVAAALAGGWWLYRSPVLRVQAIEVSGTQILDPQWVQWETNLMGQSMLTAPLEEAKARIAAIPLVKEVSLQRRWPHTIRIHIQERTPWGYWQVGNVAYPIDDEGVVIADVSPGWGAPSIVEIGPSRVLETGDRVDADAVALAQQLLTAVPQELAQQPLRFEYSHREGLTVVTESGLRVTLGDSHALSYKLALWQALLKEATERGLKVRRIDLRFGSTPSLR